jgi:phosphotransferase system enzyme I (PtsI)
LEKKVASQVGDDEASIFAAHRAILLDPAFNEKIRKAIFQSQLTVASALHETLNEYTSLFARTRDSYLIERIQDIRDVIIRISGYSSEVVQKEQDALPGPLVLVANELLPSQVAMLGEVEVCGIVTQGGSQTSHAAIIARSKGIPAVSGVRGIVRQIQSGDRIVVDGRTGHVDINPDPESLAAFRKLEREFFLLKDQLAENRHQPAVTRDQTPLSLLANINGVEDGRAIPNRVSLSHAS